MTGPKDSTAIPGRRPCVFIVQVIAPTDILVDAEIMEKSAYFCELQKHTSPVDIPLVSY
jgi:hypothetical protein